MVEFKEKNKNHWNEFSDFEENRLYFSHIASGGSISKNHFQDYINQPTISKPYDHFQNFFDNLPGIKEFYDFIKSCKQAI